MFKIVFTEQSLSRLEEALKFMKENLGFSSVKVLKINKELFIAVEPLKGNPYLGQIEEKLAHLKYSYRRIVFKHFKIIYRVEDRLYM